MEQNSGIIQKESTIKKILGESFLFWLPCDGYWLEFFVPKFGKILFHLSRFSTTVGSISQRIQMHLIKHISPPPSPRNSIQPQDDLVSTNFHQLPFVVNSTVNNNGEWVWQETYLKLAHSYSIADIFSHFNPPLLVLKTTFSFFKTFLSSLSPRSTKEV